MPFRWCARITEHAYKSGATLVTAFYSDDPATLARYRFAPDESFDTAPGWLFDGMAAAFRGGAARLAIAGEDPGLLAGQDPARLSRANKARSIAYRPALELITGFAINWCVIACATPAWARSVFPQLREGEALAKLWSAIFSCCQADLPDPVAAWEEHSATLARRTAFLNERRYPPSSIAVLAPISRSAWRRTMSGRAAPARPERHRSAMPTSRPRKSSPHRTRTRWTERSARPSRCPIRDR